MERQFRCTLPKFIGLVARCKEEYSYTFQGGPRMFTPPSLTIALLMMITSAICWGSWANTYKGVKELSFRTFLLGLRHWYFSDFSGPRIHHGQ